MAKKQHDRRPDPRRRTRPSAVERPTPGFEDLELFQEVRRALRSDEPLDFVALVCTLIEASDKRNHLFQPREAPVPQLEELVAAFIDTPYAETTAVLTLIATLTSDDDLRTQITGELAKRRHPLPRWLTNLEQSRVHDRIFRLNDPLGDGEDYFLGIELPDHSDIVCYVYVDHNLGGAVKDAHFAARGYESFLADIAAMAKEPGQELVPVDPADARAVLEKAITHGASFFPPIETQSWPAGRPLIEWMLRLLPGGGRAPELRIWEEAEVDALAKEFLASPFGRGLRGDDDAEGLLDNLLWFGTSYLDCDPLRWSGVKVELLLTDWMPRKVVAPVRYLRRLPEVLRPFISYALTERGLVEEWGPDVLAAVDRFQPDYLSRIKGSRGNSAMSELFSTMIDPAAMGDLSPTWLLDHLVGGPEQLAALDEDPLPEEPFAWDGIRDSIHTKVAETLAVAERVVPGLLGAEQLTAVKRLLARVASTEPRLFNGRTAPARSAAALAWVIGRGNGDIGEASSPVKVKDLLAAFDVSGSVSERGHHFMSAADIHDDHFTGGLALGTPDLLVSARRRALIRQRDLANEDL